jgi:hypothetical protein
LRNRSWQSDFPIKAPHSPPEYVKLTEMLVPFRRDVPHLASKLLIRGRSFGTDVLCCQYTSPPLGYGYCLLTSVEEIPCTPKGAADACELEQFGVPNLDCTPLYKLNENFTQKHRSSNVSSHCISHFGRYCFHQCDSGVLEQQ